MNPAQAADLAVLGKTIAGCRLDQLSATGGSGLVYRGTHIELNIAVAIKLIPRSMFSDLESEERFVREARNLSRIRHAHVIEVIKAGRAGNWNYLVMPWVEGATLAEYMAHVGSMDIQEVLCLAEQLLEALEAIHAKGILHRDLKPSNILRRADGNVLVADFGVARSRMDPGITMTGQFVGTPEYASPEQIRGEDLDARSDLYALGVLLYQALTGVSPFVGATIAETIKRHQERGFEPLGRLRQLPSPLERLVERLMLPEPIQRYSSAHSALEDLRQDALALDLGHGFRKLAVNLGRMPWRRLARGGRIALAIALLMGLAVAAPVVYWTIQRQRELRTSEEAEAAMRAALKKGDFVGAVELNRTAQAAFRSVRGRLQGDAQKRVIAMAARLDTLGAALEQLAQLSNDPTTQVVWQKHGKMLWGSDPDVWAAALNVVRTAAAAEHSEWLFAQLLPALRQPNCPASFRRAVLETLEGAHHEVTDAQYQELMSVLPERERLWLAARYEGRFGSTPAAETYLKGIYGELLYAKDQEVIDGARSWFANKGVR